MGAFRLWGSPEPAGFEAVAGDGAVESGVAEGEDPPVGSDEPVTAPVGGRRDADDGRWRCSDPVDP